MDAEIAPIANDVERSRTGTTTTTRTIGATRRSTDTNPGLGPCKFTILPYIFAVSTTELALLEVKKAFQANKPADVPTEEFLLKFLESVELDNSSEDEQAMAQMLARGVVARKRLENAEGGSLSSDQVADLLGLSNRQAVIYRRETRKLLAYRATPGTWRYPCWQFNERGVLSGVADVLAKLDTDSGYGAMVYFLSASYSLGSKRPLDLLRDGKVEELVFDASRYQIHGAT